MTLSGSTSSNRVLLEIIGGIEDGLFFLGQPPEIYVGRRDPNLKPPNDLALGNFDISCSRRQARLYHENNTWYLEDRPESRWGTFVHAKRLVSSEDKIRKGQDQGLNLPLQAGVESMNASDWFIVGKSVILFETRATSVPATTDAKPAFDQEITRILHRARKDSTIAHGYLSVELLFKALIEAEDELIQKLFLETKLHPRDLSEQVSLYDPWSGERGWIGGFLEIVNPNYTGVQLDQSNPPLTPRVNRLLHNCETWRTETASERIKPMHLLLSLLNERNCLPVMALNSIDVDCAALSRVGREMLFLEGTVAVKTPVPPQAEPKPGAGKPKAAPESSQEKPDVKPAPKQQKKAKPPKEKFDFATWSLANDLLDELMTVQADHAASSSGERVGLLRSHLVTTFKKMPEDKRRKVASQLEGLLAIKVNPVEYELGATVPENALQPDSRTDETTTGEEMAQGHGNTRPELIPQSRDDLPLQVSDPKMMVELFYNFIRDIESSIIKIMVGFYAGKPSIDLLPGWNTTLVDLMSQMGEMDEAESVEKLREFLNDLKLWTMSLLLAPETAFDQYIKLTWEKLNPQTIQSKVSPRSLNPSKQCWDEYKSRVQNLEYEWAWTDYKRILKNQVDESYKLLKRRSNVEGKNQ